jgi:tetratricopeptide (TPR) repeat protein
MDARRRNPPPEVPAVLADAPDASLAVQSLCREGVWPARAQQLAVRHPWQRIQRAIEYVRLRRLQSRIANPAAYLVEVLDTATDVSFKVVLRKHRTTTACSSANPPPEPEVTAAAWQRLCEQDLASARQRAGLRDIVEALAMLVAHHREQGELTRAIQYQQEAVSLDHRAHAVEKLGDLHLQARHIDQARAAYSEAIDLWRHVPGATPRVDFLRAKLRELSTTG